MKALLLVDIQYDFLPGGALAVPGGDAVIPVANALIPNFELVIATQDWHPPDHQSFAAQHEGKQVGDLIDLKGLEQILWPVHCVQHTRGAEFHEDLKRNAIAKVFRKGIDRDIDSYSGFFDNGHRRNTGLGKYLKERGVRAVYLAGLATDYCVKFSALDARRLGFETHLVVDGCRGVALNPGDVEGAIAEMKDVGVSVVESRRLLASQAH